MDPNDQRKLKQHETIFKIFSFINVILVLSLLFFAAPSKTAVETNPAKQIYTNNSNIALSIEHKNIKNLSKKDLEKIAPVNESEILLSGYKNDASYETTVYLKRSDLSLDKVPDDAIISKVELYKETYKPKVGPFVFKPESKTYVKFSFGSDKDVDAIKDLIEVK